MCRALGRVSECHKRALEDTDSMLLLMVECAHLESSETNSKEKQDRMDRSKVGMGRYKK